MMNFGAGNDRPLCASYPVQAGSLTGQRSARLITEAPSRSSWPAKGAMGCAPDFGGVQTNRGILTQSPKRSLWLRQYIGALPAVRRVFLSRKPRYRGGGSDRPPPHLGDP
jgi:hypothetical protein